MSEKNNNKINHKIRSYVIDKPIIIDNTTLATSSTAPPSFFLAGAFGAGSLAFVAGAVDVVGIIAGGFRDGVGITGLGQDTGIGHPSKIVNHTLMCGVRPHFLDVLFNRSS